MERGEDVATRALRREIRAQHPRFLDAVLEDAKVTASYRAERLEPGFRAVQHLREERVARPHQPEHLADGVDT